MAPYEALCDQKRKSSITWLEVSESKLLGPDLVQQVVEKVKLINERSLVAQSRQKSIVHRIGEVAYELDLSPDLESEHPIFHVSILRKCIGDPSPVVLVDDLQITEDLSYEEIPVAILDHQVCRLRTNNMASVKVLWRNKNVEEMTWEVEEDMRS
ncbi:uncharacterized protein LOC132043071 [Lycium ferocissimum]|uniref:uncharacterized protein LOC132043071 n=1 Tax=Lycium ferocissimum TaxID=112874 RepID=UPI0028157C37|nr:uncharacterized protein LOC132043071 [Lycium ferocissimum]